MITIVIGAPYPNFFLVHHDLGHPKTPRPRAASHSKPCARLRKPAMPGPTGMSTKNGDLFDHNHP